MSRIGRKPINIPAGVTASVDNGVITVKGPKGTLDFKFNPAMTVEIKGDVIEVTRPNDAKETVHFTALQEHLSIIWLSVLQRVIQRLLR